MASVFPAFPGSTGIRAPIESAAANENKNPVWYRYSGCLIRSKISASERLVRKSGVLPIRKPKVPVRYIIRARTEEGPGPAIRQ